MKSTQGLTLIELMVVVAIILSLSGIIVSRLGLALKRDNLENDAKKLASNIALAQQYAIGQKDGYRYYGVEFYDVGYRIRPYENHDKPLAAVFVPSALDESGNIPFSAGTVASGTQEIIFDFTGKTLLDEDARVTLVNNSDKKIITVSRLTGYVLLN